MTWIVLKKSTSEFVGYDYTEYETSILRYRQVKQKNQTLYQIVLDKTRFMPKAAVSRRHRRIGERIPRPSR